MDLAHSPTPPLPAVSDSLPAQINAATKLQHTRLNLLIVHRLKLALPPHAHDPRSLGIGLAAFARIYYEFESAWDRVLQSPPADDHAEKLSEWLAQLRPVGLPRTSRLRDDVEHISRRTASRVDKTTRAQTAMLQKIRASIMDRPHVLIAYAWVMYMAIFSGGRWIRQQLHDAGSDFWSGLPDERDGSRPGFSFLSFDGDRDGEDTKAIFKSRLTEADTLLTDDEQRDVVAASVGLFEDCIALVELLDRAVWRDAILRKLLPVFGIVGLAILAAVYLSLIPNST